MFRRRQGQENRWIDKLPAHGAVYIFLQGQAHRQSLSYSSFFPYPAGLRAWGAFLYSLSRFSYRKVHFLGLIDRGEILGVTWWAPALSGSRSMFASGLSATAPESWQRTWLTDQIERVLGVVCTIVCSGFFYLAIRSVWLNIHNVVILADIYGNFSHT